MSGLFHVGLVIAAAAIVWRTAVAPGPAGPIGSISFEAPGNGVAPLGTPAPAETAIAEHSGEGTLVPLMEERELSAPAPSMTGLSSEPLSGMSSRTALASTLASGALFSSASAPPIGGPAVVGVADGQANVTFGGLGASSVGSVVYAVDCSGPMVTSLPIVLEELERSISRLSPNQRFGVVLFRRQTDRDPGAEWFAPVLMRATPSAKDLLHRWLAAVEPGGRSSPLAGLEMALSLRPHAVFLLSRSIPRSGGGVWETGMEPTMARLEELNPAGRGGAGAARRPVLIQTIQFLDEDPTGIMQAIGMQHGGGTGYRVVMRQQDLQAADAVRAGRSGAAPVGAPDR